MKKIAVLLFATTIFCSRIFADASGVINIAFDQMKLSGAVSLDKDIVVSSTPALKMVSKSAKHHPKAEIEITLDKDVTHYELSYYVKAENIVSTDSNKYGADIILKPAASGGLRFSSRGSYKCDIGTFDWKKVSFKIDAKRYLKEQPVKLIVHIGYASGTAWFDQIKLTPVNNKSQVKTNSSNFTFGIFPCCYQKDDESYEIAENLPAQWILKCLARPKNPPRGQLTFELELPDFLEFNGVGGFSSRTKNGYFPKHLYLRCYGLISCIFTDTGCELRHICNS